jgi:hypothetical protein
MIKLYKWFSRNFGLIGAISTLPILITAGIYGDYNELIEESMILVLFGLIYTQQLEIQSLQFEIQTQQILNQDLKDRLIQWIESLRIPYAKDKTNEAN